MTPDIEAGKTPEARTSSAPKVFEYIGEDRPMSHLTWKKLSYSVAVKKGRKQILTDVTGELKPGELTCILGPSGSGKTTLLNILSGRTGAGGRFKAEINGEVALNATPLSPVQEQHIFGYVMQDDALYATETPREILDFSARLRLMGVDQSKIAALLDDLLNALGLNTCADTVVGNEMIKGISGGQRKRTSIGAELIVNPAITFLDEPTSGLDTAAAFTVCSVLKQLAMAKQAVMCTIHQPSSEIFHLFDSAIFIARGHIMYQGHPNGIRAHFDKLNFTCPEDYNPADFVMFLVQTEDDQRFEKLTHGWAAVASVEVAKDEKAVALPKRLPGKGFVTELRMLTARQLRCTVRDKASLGGRFGLSIFLNLIFGVIFLGVGNTEKSDYDIQSHAGAITMVAISSMFGCTQPSLLSFPSERPVFLREYASNMYGVVPYFLSKTVIELCLLVMQITVIMVIAYWLMHLNGNFGIYIVAFSLLGAASSSVGLLIGCAVGEVKLALELVPLCFVPQMLFAGFFVKLSKIPVWLRWIQYICALKWATNISWTNEFDGTKYHYAVLTTNDINPSRDWLNFVILGVLIVGFRVWAMMVLRRKAKTVYG